MEGVEVQPHIKLRKGQVEPVVVVVGDPARALKFAEGCESHEPLAKNREYHSYGCTMDGQKITVISHGVGVPGCAICVEELIACGAKIIIRAGTCGSLRPKEIKQGDVFIAIGAADSGGCCDPIVPVGTPAISDFGVYGQLKKSASDLGLATKEGIILTENFFYPSPFKSKDLKQWAGYCETVEMELSCILHICRYRKCKAAGIFTVDGSPLKWDEGDYDPTSNKTQDGVTRMLWITRKTAAALRKEL